MIVLGGLGWKYSTMFLPVWQHCILPTHNGDIKKRQSLGNKGGGRGEGGLSWGDVLRESEFILLLASSTAVREFSRALKMLEKIWG